MDIDWIAAPKQLLYIFPNYPRLHNWLMANESTIIKLGGVIERINHRITFPSGNVLNLGHAENEDQLQKFYGLEYDLIGGTSDEFLKIRELFRRCF